MRAAFRVVRPRQVAISRRGFHMSPSSEELFNKVLIANRGEIACRIIRTCKRLGIKTVAVHSDADVFSKHVELADEAVNVGPAPSKDSYLRIDRIIEAVKSTGAEAVHPGYGFLSENNTFVAELEKAGVRFVGPNSHAIHAMGDKIQSKLLAKEAGVNVIPGYMGEVKDVDEAIRIANEVGYPVMIKASAGGGGKGMRIAWNDAETKEGYRLSKQESMAAFGDDRLLIERYIDNPRHVEIQVLCDTHGTRLYLNERECSIQRRNQKVIEEAPSPFLTPEVRKAMGEQAVALCAKVGYVSAGTVEFLVDSQRNFYFLEMNTRLQVEHPITEYVTGIDIVEQMLRVAAGEKLPITQDQVELKGWAVEARVYAEDPLQGFLPSIGRLNDYQEPLVEVPNATDPIVDRNVTVRVDSGVKEGSQISMYYDPLISKLVTYGETRDQALDTMSDALDRYVIRGLNHNVNFIRDVLDNKRFREGRLSTKFIAEEYPEGFKGKVLDDKETTTFLCVTAALAHLRAIRDNSINPVPTEPDGRYYIRFLEREYGAYVESIGDHEFEVSFISAKGQATEPILVDLSQYPIDSPIIWSEVNQESVVMQLNKVTPLGYQLQFKGTVYPVEVVSPLEAEYLQYMKPPPKIDTHNLLLSPMSGTLVSVAVNVGDVVAPGMEIAVVEAMKMQNVLRSVRAGRIKAIKAEVGKPVNIEDIVVEFEDVPEQSGTK